MLWERIGEAFYATIRDANDRTMFHLIVEPIPGGGWDWAVWPPRHATATTRHGEAHTAQEAMRAAEGVVGL